MAQQSKVGSTATTIYRDRDSAVTRVIYHHTAVVSFDDRTVTLDSGGWRSATTKTRMNQASNQFGLGFTVYQDNFAWYVRMPNGEAVEFTDGLTFDYR